MNFVVCYAYLYLRERESVRDSFYATQKMKFSIIDFFSNRTKSAGNWGFDHFSSGNP